MATKNRWMSDILEKVTKEVKEYTDSDFHTFINVNGERIPLSIDNISFSKMDTNDPEMELHIGSKEGKEECSMGNAAAMRKALENIVNVGYPHNFQHEAPHISGYCYEITDAITKCFEALAAPPRNCDRFGFLDLARLAFQKVEAMPEGNDDTQMRGWINRFIEWIFAPATEQEGETDGSK